MSNYELQVVSHLKEFEGKILKKFNVEGVETVGAYGDEPFSIRFKNNTWQKIQVKISLDGTDILTGDKATTEPTSNMWVVNPFATIELHAFPETSNGGAGFVFTNAENGVAVHTHGDVSCRGIIAAAVYTEGHIEPIKPVIINNPYYPPYYYFPYSFGDYPSWGTTTFGRGTFSITGNDITFGDKGTITVNCVGDLSLETNGKIMLDSPNVNKELQSVAAVGAGDYVEQKITYVAGLIKPILSETLQVRYLWWDELKAKLKEFNKPVMHASGFPGDTEQQIMSLGKTPRVSTFRRVPEATSENYSRV